MPIESAAQIGVDMPSVLLEPVVQYGFLGFSIVLLAVVIWLIRKLLMVLDRNNEVITANTQAVESLCKTTSELMKLNRDVHDKLLSRPCIAKGE